MWNELYNNINNQFQNPTNIYILFILFSTTNYNNVGFVIYTQTNCVQ